MDEKRRLELFEELTQHSPNCIVSLAVPLIAHALVIQSNGDKQLAILNYARVGQAMSECIAHLFKLHDNKVEKDAADQVKELFDTLGIKT